MKFTSKIINYLYLVLLFFTPLIFTSWNSELFELPKMYFVYSITILIVLFHLINTIHRVVPFFKKNILTLPLFLFLASQVLSNIFSIDPHTSFFGYYSRLNGGLLSIISFSLLLLILPIYLNGKFLKQIINVSLLSGFLVSIYAIAQHFGIDNNKWIQDVQSRVFSSLGQPNWLAAYLCLLLPIGLYKNISEYNKKHITTSLFALINISFYISILFTKSKSGIISAAISLSIFLIVYLLKFQKSQKNNPPFLREEVRSSEQVGFVLILFTIFTLSSFIIKNPISDKLFPSSITTPVSPTTSTSSLNITASEDIRKIVWAGSIDLWKKFPFFGTGVETFAYSYYWTRPVSHNLTSEWDFLYNKAHNEYLNYLATTGAIGLLTYAAFIIFSFILVLKSNSDPLFKLALCTSLISILITNAAGFSVVIVSLYFFILPALSQTQNEISAKTIKPKTTFFTNLLIFALIGFALFLIQKNIFYYLADIAYSKASSADEKSDFQTAYENINTAVSFRSNEPTYLIKMATITSQIAASAHISKEEELVSKLIDKSTNYANVAVNISPTNTNFWKERAQVYYYLSTIKPEYFQESISSLLKVAALAPTDAKTFYLIGQFLEIGNDKDNAAVYYQKAIDLKSNYDHAYFSLAVIQFDQKKYIESKDNFEKVLQFAPTNTDAKGYLDKIKAL